MRRYQDIIITASNASDPIDWPSDSGVIEAYAATWNSATVKLQKRRHADDDWRDIPNAVLSSDAPEVGFTAGVCQLRLLGTGVTSVAVRISALGVGYRVDVPR